jgi:hypothetical protein
MVTATCEHLTCDTVDCPCDCHHPLTHKVGHRESQLKSELTEMAKVVIPTFVCLTFEDVRRSGNPDKAFIGFGQTTWIEVKHGTPSFEWKGVQNETMIRLSAAGRAWYLVYLENTRGEHQRTLIVAPRFIDRLELANASTVGHDHRWVCRWIRDEHLR